MLIHTIKEEDMGKYSLDFNNIKGATCEHCGRTDDFPRLLVANLLGRIMRVDIGKRIYFDRIKRTYHLESMNQFKTRIKNNY